MTKESGNHRIVENFASFDLQVVIYFSARMIK